MKSSSLLRFNALAVLSLGAVLSHGLSGCGCWTPPTTDGGTDGGSATIAFVTPRDGFILNNADDEDGDPENGIQLDVRVRYSGANGTEVTLTSDQGGTATAAADDGFVTFADFTLTSSEAGVVHALTASDGDVSDTISVTATRSPTATVTCAFVSPTDGTTLTMDSNAVQAGFQFPVRVACTGDGLSVGMPVFFNAGSGEVAGSLNANREATATVTAGDDDGTNTVTARLENADGDVLDEVSISVTVNPDGGPTCTITAPTDGASFDEADDVDTGAPGFQLSVTVTCAGEGVAAGQAVVVSAGGANVTGSLAGTPLSTTVTATAGNPNGSNTITATLQGLNISAPPVSVTVQTDLTVCNATITAPADGAIFDGTAVDADPGTPEFEIAVSITATTSPVAGGSCEDAVATVNDGTNDLTATVQADNTAVVLVPLADGTYTLTATVTNENGDGTSEAIDVTVDRTGPAIVVDSPQDGEVYGPTDDLDGNIANGISLTFAGTITGATSATFDLNCNGGDIDDGTLTLAGDGTFATTLDDLPLGSCTLDVTATDGVNGAMWTATFTTADISTTVTLGDGVDQAPLGFFIASEDATPGGDMDIELSVTADFMSGTYTASYDVVRTSDAVTVLNDVDLGTLTSGVASTSTISLPYSDATEYDVVITFTPSSGPAIVQTETIVVDTVVPTLSWQTPTPGFAYRATDDQSPNPGFQAFFALNSTGARGLVVALSFTGSGTTTSQCTVSNTDFCSASITIGDGAWTGTASVTDPAGNVASPVNVTFTVDATLPEVSAIVVAADTVDANGAANPDGYVNRAENGGAAAPAVTSVTVTFNPTAGMEDGRAITLTVTPPGTVYNGTVTGNSATFNGVSLAEGTETLTVNGTDLVGNPIALVGKTRTITVDTIVPTIAIVAPNSAVIAGTSATISVSSNAGDGRVVTLSDVTAASQALGTQALAGGSANFVDVALQQGIRTLRAEVTDVAGNPASADRVYNVDSQAPVLVLTTLSSPAVDADLAAAGWQVDFQVDHTGLETGREIRIVSNLTGQRGQAAAEADGSNVIRATFTTSATHQITAQATDAAGNLGVSNTVSVDIATGQYDVFVDSPVPQGALLAFGAADVTGGVASISVTVPALAVGAESNTELRIDGTPVGGASTFRTGDVLTVTWTVTEGATGTLEVYVDDGAMDGTSGVFDYIVDAVAPTVTWNGGSPTVFNIATDTAPGVAGLQTTVQVDVTECESGLVEVLEGALLLGSASVGAGGSGTIAVDLVDTVEHTSVTWTARCTDVGVNVGSDDLVTTVDITAPAVTGLVATTLDPKRGIISIDATAPGDDGIVGGPVTLDVVASRSALTLGTFDAAALTPVFPGRGGLVATNGSTASGAVFNVDTAGLAFDTTWTIAVRATDDVGNASLASATVSDLGLGAVSLAHTDDGIGCDDRFPRGTTASADFNGDGFTDLVLSAPSTGDLQGFGCFFDFGDGSIRLWHGRADLSEIAIGSPSRSVADVNVSYGLARRMGVADLDNDGRADLIVYAEDQNFPYQMYVDVFYGVNTTTAGVPDLVEATPRHILMGGGDPNYDYFVDTIRGIGDVNGDGFEDVWFGPAQFLAGEQLRGRILFGSATKIPDGSSFSALNHAIVTSTIAGVSALGGAAPLGNLDGDTAGGNPLDDFAVRQQDGPIVVVRGRTTWPVPPATFDLATIAAADRLQCVSDQCALEMTAGDVNGDGAADLAAVNPVDGLVAIYLNTGSGALATTRSYSLKPAGGLVAYLTSHLAVGDLNDDGYDDVLFASSNAGGEPTAMRVFFGGAYTTGNGITAGLRTTADITYSLAHTAAEPAVAEACGDLDNDGTSELCFGSELGDGVFHVRY